MPHSSKAGRKNNQKQQNNRGMESVFTPPIISDTVDILSQTRQLLDNNSLTMNPNGVQNTVLNSNSMQPMNNVNVDNTNMATCTMNPQYQQVQSGVSPQNIGHRNRNAQRVSVDNQGSQTFQSLPQGQNNSAIYQAVPNVSQEHYSAGMDRGPVVPPVTTMISNMLLSLEQKLGQKLLNIENHLQTQNKRWENVESQLQNQNTRMIAIEQQVSQMNILKQNLSETQTHVLQIDQQMTELKAKVGDYDKSINNYSELCDDIVTSTSETDSKLSYLLKKVESLEASQAKTDDRLVDLQWRSMRENLIFTGIPEPYLPEGEFENVEGTLRQFLRDEMDIDRDIAFDRVHRLGRYDMYKKYPRPIIAKFERYRDKEAVRKAAPQSLFGKRYGVREQFPPEIEEKRKVLYPEAKKARGNKNNVVRLVRDKLFVNGREVKVDSQAKGSEHQRLTQNHTQTFFNINRSENLQRERTRYEPNMQSRTVYASSRGKPNQYNTRDRGKQNADRTWSGTVRTGIPVKNSFDPLMGDDSENSICGGGFVNDRKSVKKKATSPLDRDISFKKQKDRANDTISVHSESDSSSQMDTEAQYSDEKVLCTKGKETTVTSSVRFTVSPLVTEDTDKQQQISTGTTVGSEPRNNENVQNSQDVSQSCKTTPGNVSQLSKSDNFCESVSSPTVKNDRSSESASIQMPVFTESSSILYYGPAVNSPPLGNVNIIPNTQLSAGSNDSLRCNDGLNENS